MVLRLSVAIAQTDHGSLRLLLDAIGQQTLPASARERPPLRRGFFARGVRLPKTESAMPRYLIWFGANGTPIDGGATKVGGTPDWIQNEEMPVCPRCNSRMALLFQLDAFGARASNAGVDAARSMGSSTTRRGSACRGRPSLRPCGYYQIRGCSAPWLARDHDRGNRPIALRIPKESR